MGRQYVMVSCLLTREILSCKVCDATLSAREITGAAVKVFKV